MKRIDINANRSLFDFVCWWVNKTTLNSVSKSISRSMSNTTTISIGNYIKDNI